MHLCATPAVPTREGLDTFVTHCMQQLLQYAAMLQLGCSGCALASMQQQNLYVQVANRAKSLSFKHVFWTFLSL